MFQKIVKNYSLDLWAASKG